MLRIMGGIVSISIQRDLAYRTDIFVRLALSAVAAVSAMVALTALYSRVDHLAGWTFGEAVLVLGIFMMVNGVILTFVEPNLEWFAEKLRQGMLDDVLVKPVSSLFLTSFATSRPWSLVDVVVGGIVSAIGISSLRDPVTAGGVGAGLLLVGVGVLSAWAIRMGCAAAAFWAPGLELSVFWYAPWTLGRYPLDTYGRVARAALTYVLPVAFVSTFPARALTRGATPELLIGGLVTAAIVSVAITLLWRAALRRYTSATS
jgi:ABC-2 type transport system permease protein